MALSGPRAVSRLKLLFVVTEDWYFCSHRLALARAALEAGFDVTVATRVAHHAEAIRGAGIGLVALVMRRRGIHPLRELATLRELVALYRRECPDIVHHVAMKPVIYGSVAARLARVPVVVNALAGLGFVFTSSGARAALLRPFVRYALAKLLSASRAHVIVQNPDDRAVVAGLGMAAERIHVIRGSGVDIDAFSPSPEPDAPVVVTMVSRMLWDKGVGDLVAAARHLRARGELPRIVLAGTPDPENPATIAEHRLRAWHDEGLVEWRGHCADVAALWGESHVAVLPSHREGLPKALLEAGACGRPLIATDVPGCREVVEEGVNGFLVPARDPLALADRIARLAGDADLRRQMGVRARQRIVECFAQARVVNETLALYRDVPASG